MIVPFTEVVWFQEGPGVRNTQYAQNGIKLLNVANLVDGKVDLSTSNRYISAEEAYGKYKHFLVDDGDFIIASSGIKVEYFDRKMGFITSEQLPLCMNTSTIRFKTLNKDILDIRYFMYFLKTDLFKEQLSREITGSAQLNFGPSHLKKMFIPIVDIESQFEAVRNLDKVTSMIDNHNIQLQKLDELVKARFIEMFGDFVLNQKGWSKGFLGEECDVRDGTHDSPEYYDEGYPLVTSKNVTGGRIDLSECNLISETDYKKINERSKVDFGDIIMPMIGTVGSPVIVDIEPNFAIKNVALIKFKEGSRVLNVYIKALLKSDYFDRAVLSKIRGGTQKFIALGDIRKLEILLPPMELQNQFADFVEKVGKQKEQIQKSLEKVEMLKKALMQKYFG